MSKLDSTKYCPKCKETKCRSQFGLVRGEIRCYCKPCHRDGNNNPDLRTEKRCACCLTIKPIGEFNKCKFRFQSWCKACGNDRLAEIRKNQKLSGENVEINRRDYWKRRRWIKVKTKYGLTKEQYEQMVLEHDNKCAICRMPEKELDGNHGSPLSLSVDHNHATGKVRGLLCRQCNIGIGRLKEDVGILQNAIDYLNKYSE